MWAYQLVTGKYYFSGDQGSRTLSAMAAVPAFGFVLRRGGKAVLTAIHLSGEAQRWWPKISNVATDWAAKGAHIKVNNVELAVRPSQDGGIVFRSVFARQSPRDVAAASKIAREALEDVVFRQELYNASGRVIESLDGAGRSVELRFLMHALEKMGL